MPKVSVLKAVSKDSFPVMASTVTSTWLTGTGFSLNSLGYAVQGNVDNIIGIAGDAANEVVAPPSGSLLTLYYGSGTRLEIDHTAEVAAGTVTDAYLAYSKTEVEASIRGQLLYLGTAGKWQTTATGSIKGIVAQVPASSNNYTLGLIMRF